MMPSHPINDRSGRLQSRWFASSNPADREVALDSKPRAAPIWSPTVQPAAVPPSLAVYSSTNQLLRPHRATILRSRAAAKSHSLQHFPRTTRRRDFVPWRFSAAGRHGAPLDRHHRRPKTLYGAYRCQPKNYHASESFCHVTSLRCGTATPLLGCAERSSPEARVRRAEGAGLDRECADRVTIIVPRRTNDFYFVSSPFIDLIGPAAFRCKFDMIRGGARQRARKSRHSLVFG